MYANRGSNNHGLGGEAVRQSTPYRQAFNNLDPNVYGNSNRPGYVGMGSGVKVGRPHATPGGYGAVGSGRMNGYVGLNVR